MPCSSFGDSSWTPKVGAVHPIDAPVHVDRSHTDGRHDREIRPAEFVAVTALLTAMGALAIDTILPAFRDIRAHLGLGADSTRVSLLVTAYLVGMGLGQIPAGILADRFGRRRTLYGFVALYAAGVLATALSPTLPTMVAARCVWGIGGAGPRAVAIAMVRDTHQGVRMAQVLSYVQSIFVIVPVIAPTLGTLALHAGGWRATVFVPGAVAVVLSVWLLRIPETLPTSQRRAANVDAVREAAARVLRDRPTRYAAAAMALLFGCISSYISLAETIIDDVYGRKAQFPLVFGAIAATMGVSTLLNARLVGRFGLRPMLRTVPAVAAVVSLVLAAVSFLTDGKPPFAVFSIGMALLLSVQTLVTPNVQTTAMAAHGHSIGLTAGILGTIATIGGAFLGTVTSQSHDGTTRTLFTAIALFLCGSFLFIRRATKSLGDRAGEQ